MEEEKHLVDSPKAQIPFRYKLLVAVAIVSLTLLAIGLIAAIIGILVSDNVFSSTESTTCTTPECVKLAATVLSNMDTSVDPCEDFYNYSCGGWDARNLIPSGYGSWGVFQELAKQNTIFIEKLVTSNVDDSIKAIKLTRTLYDSCVDMDKLDELGAAPLIKLINSTGGWDLVNIKNASSPDYKLGNADFKTSIQYGNGAFFSFGISVNDKNSSQYVASLTQSGLSLPDKSSYNDSSYTSALHTYITSVLKLIDPSASSESLDEAANQIVDMETALAEIFVSNVDLRNIDATYNPYILSGNLSDGSLWKQFNWSTFLEGTFEDAGVKIPDDLLVIVKTPSYFQNLSTVYGNFNATVHENYFKWQLISGYIGYLGSDFLTAYYTFTSATVGSGKVDRYITCISTLEDIVPMSVSRLYTEFILPNGTRGNVTEMITNIKDAFKARLDENPWIDDETRQRSKWKVGNITEMIAYPDGIYNDTKLDIETAVVTKGSGSLFGTVLSFNIEEYFKNLRKFGKPVDKTEWEIAPTVVNAYYEPLYNGFVFLEGILNRPFFDAAWPYYFNYGAFGVVIGHELTHGFDDQGQRYNQDGVLTPWWTKKSVDEFNKLKTCFVNQYSQYSMFGYSVDGSLTLGENIADNGGVKTAYQAFQTISKDKDLPTLPGVDLSPDELFFVAFGQVWCSIFSPQFIHSNLKTNPHSPGPYRVIGSLSNSEDFAKVFKCPVGSRMNPKDKCDLW